MAAIAALLDGRSGFAAVRRSLPKSPIQFLPCRSPRDLEAALQRRLIEVILLGTRAAGRVGLEQLCARYPAIPIAIFGGIRAEDATSLSAWDRSGVALVLVDGVDDAVAGDHLLRHTASRRRLAGLAEYPRMLRLTEPLQLRAWDRMAAAPGRPVGSAVLARELGVSREHLSRQFGAGGAPNLKRVSDLLTVQRAVDLLANPGYSPGTVARLLGFASPSHLRTVVRRLLGAGLDEARGMTIRELPRRFLKHCR